MDGVVPAFFQPIDYCFAMEIFVGDGLKNQNKLPWLLAHTTY